MDVQRLAELGRARLQAAVAALHLAGVKVLQDSEGEREGERAVGGCCGHSQEGLQEAADLHGRHGFVLEGDEGHAQWLGVDLLLLLPVLLLQLGFPLGVEAHRLLLREDELHDTHGATALEAQC